MSEIGIRLENIRKVYPRKFVDHLTTLAANVVGHPNAATRGGVAIDNLSLSIRQGERIGIIGKNGAGKSTLLQMLAGVADPTSGKIQISGRVTAVLTLGVGLRDDLTGRENIYLDGEVQGKVRAEIDLDIQKIIDFAELGKFIDLPLRTYSTGMKARLAFAMITQVAPEILIIDETLSVGDAAFSSKAAKRISELCAKGSIVLIVSHSMQSIRSLCNRCIWLQDGKLLMDGPPDEVTAAYLESVRLEDEFDLAIRFRSMMGEKTFQPGFSISPIEVTSNGERVNRISSGDSLTVSCDFQMPSNQTLGCWQLRCFRIDGVLILEHMFRPKTNVAQKRIKITYPSFILAPGIFRFNLRWMDNNGVVRAEANTMIEIISDEAISGGRPVLLVKGTVHGMAEEKK